MGALLKTLQEQILGLMQNPTIVLLMGVFLGILFTIGVKAHKLHFVVLSLIVAFFLIYLFNM